MLLYVRNEVNQNEHRTPIIPQDIPILLHRGYIIYIESSQHRIYKDEEYENKGAIITTLPWYSPEFTPAYIIGLKELRELDKLDSHRHIYFSHCHKKQKGSEIILDAFNKSNSHLYDFEHFVDGNNKRLISFGFYAGIVGCFLGLFQYIQKIQGLPNIKNLTSWNSKEEVIGQLKKDRAFISGARIAILGAYGNCGKGVISILEEQGISYDILTKTSNSTDFINYDIFFNCILLDMAYDKIWFSSDTVFLKHLLIVDISCDYSKPNNPIAIYNTETTWEEPVYSYNNMVDVIAINNLPSLLPKDSSDYFSNRFTGLLSMPLIPYGQPTAPWIH